eukprot:scaffold1268_cov174-Ochromonas_danica.AAC.9
MNYRGDLGGTYGPGVDVGAKDCNSLWGCYKFVLCYGIRQGGGIGNVMQLRTNWLWVIHILYFLVVIVMLLNIIFGIIIDTFSSLRAEKNERLRDTEEVCFICGIDKQIFDRASDEPDGFRTHVKIDHNMWNYLYFIFMLWEQDRDDDDGLEQYVRRAIEANEITWFPIRKAIRLDQAASEEEITLKEVSEALDSFEQKLNSKIASFQVEMNGILDLWSRASKGEFVPGNVKTGIARFLQDHAIAPDSSVVEEGAEPGSQIVSAAGDSFHGFDDLEEGEVGHLDDGDDDEASHDFMEIPLHGKGRAEDRDDTSSVPFPNNERDMELESVDEDKQSVHPEKREMIQDDEVQEEEKAETEEVFGVQLTLPSSRLNKRKHNTSESAGGAGPGGATIISISSSSEGGTGGVESISISQISSRLDPSKPTDALQETSAITAMSASSPAASVSSEKREQLTAIDEAQDLEEALDQSVSVVSVLTDSPGASPPISPHHHFQTDDMPHETTSLFLASASPLDGVDTNPVVEEIPTENKDNDIDTDQHVKPIEEEATLSPPSFAMEIEDGVMQEAEDVAEEADAAVEIPLPSSSFAMEIEDGVMQEAEDVVDEADAAVEIPLPSSSFAMEMKMKEEEEKEDEVQQEEEEKEEDESADVFQPLPPPDNDMIEEEDQPIESLPPVSPKEAPPAALSSELALQWEAEVEEEFQGLPDVSSLPFSEKIALTTRDRAIVDGKEEEDQLEEVTGLESDEALISRDGEREENDSAGPAFSHQTMISPSPRFLRHDAAEEFVQSLLFHAAADRNSPHSHEEKDSLLVEDVAAPEALREEGDAGGQAVEDEERVDGQDSVEVLSAVDGGNEEEEETVKSAEKMSPRAVDVPMEPALPPEEEEEEEEEEDEEEVDPSASEAVANNSSRTNEQLLATNFVESLFSKDLDEEE